MGLACTLRRSSPGSPSTARSVSRSSLVKVIPTLRTGRRDPLEPLPDVRIARNSVHKFGPACSSMAVSSFVGGPAVILTGALMMSTPFLSIVRSSTSFLNSISKGERLGPKRSRTSGGFALRLGQGGPERRIISIRLDASLLPDVVAVRRAVRDRGRGLGEGQDRRPQRLIADFDGALDHHALQHVVDPPDVPQHHSARIRFDGRRRPDAAVVVAGAQLTFNALLRLLWQAYALQAKRGREASALRRAAGHRSVCECSRPPSPGRPPRDHQDRIGNR